MAKKKYEEPIVEEVAAETQREPDLDTENAAEPVTVTEDAKEDFDPDFVAIENVAVEPAEREPDPNYPFDNSEARFPAGTPVYKYAGSDHIVGHIERPLTIDRASVMVGDVMWYKVAGGWIKK